MKFAGYAFKVINNSYGYKFMNIRYYNVMWKYFLLYFIVLYILLKYTV